MTEFLPGISEYQFAQDPYPIYRYLRDELPIYHHKGSNMWFVTRYHDIESALQDYQTFTSSAGNTVIDSPLRVGKTLGSMDPPRHDELRRVIQRALGPARIEAAVNKARELTTRKLAELGPSGECDLVDDIGRPILTTVLGMLLGLDEAGSIASGKMIEGLFHQEGGLLASPLDPQSFAGIFGYLGDRVASGGTADGDDLISILLEMQRSGAPMTEVELVANLSTVLLAGNASIGHFFPNILHALWLHPDQRTRVLNDLSLIPAAVEESVRWDTSTQSFARQTTRNVEMHGVTVPEGSRMVVFYASANRDERVIEDPDTFDIARKRVRHFGFGMGPHICAGSQIARAVLKGMLEILLPALGNYELDLSRAKRVQHIMVRGFINLPIRW